MAKAKNSENRWSDIDGGSAFVIPYTLLRHPNFARLSPYGCKLLHDLARQYSGFNNGYLSASWTLMKKAGWRSSETLWRAVRECEHYRLIERTQQGDKNKPNLHAFTWRRIDEKKNQNPLDSPPTMAPTDAWKDVVDAFVMKIEHRKSKPKVRRLKAA